MNDGRTQNKLPSSVFSPQQSQVYSCLSLLHSEARVCSSIGSREIHGDGKCVCARVCVLFQTTQPLHLYHGDSCVPLLAIPRVNSSNSTTIVTSSVIAWKSLFFTQPLFRGIYDTSYVSYSLYTANFVLRILRVCMINSQNVNVQVQRGDRYTAVLLL